MKVLTGPNFDAHSFVIAFEFTKQEIVDLSHELILTFEALRLNEGFVSVSDYVRALQAIVDAIEE